MPKRSSAIDVVVTPQLTIREYFGNVATKDPRLSAAHVRVTAECSEEWQTPDFDEYVLVVDGEVHLQHAEGTTIVRGGTGVLLHAGLRVKWIFPGPAEYIPICLPSFSPDNVHREESDGGSAIGTTPAHLEGLLKVATPVDVVQATNLTITEYFGHVASEDPRLSACIAKVTAPCTEAYQAPEFDEYVLVLNGEVHLQQPESTTVVRAGEAVLLQAGERVRWIWPGDCTYIPVCLPAFSPETCHREEEEGAAKDKDTMDRLHALHAGVKEPVASNQEVA